MAGDQSRFTLALDFACAAVSVLLSGHVADRLVAADQAPARSASRNYGAYPLLGGISRREFMNGGRYCGAFARVAKQRGVSRSYVSGVCNGSWVRADLLDAVLREMARIDGAPAPDADCAPLNPQELSEFARGEKYYGVYAEVTKKIGRSCTYVCRIARGTTSRPEVVRAIRMEMRRIDAELEEPVRQLSCDEVAEFQRGGRYYGIGSRVSQSLGVTRTYASAVIRGVPLSQGVLKALRAEMATVDQDFQPPPAPLTTEERSQFARGGRYYGVFSRTASVTGRNASQVRNVGAGACASRTVLEAIRVEMARVDAELAAKDCGGRA